jgi:hypothetical protein
LGFIFHSKHTASAAVFHNLTSTGSFPQIERRPLVTHDWRN